jgi:hypothetical protein
MLPRSRQAVMLIENVRLTNGALFPGTSASHTRRDALVRCGRYRPRETIFRNGILS